MTWHSLDEWCGQVPWGWHALHDRVSELVSFTEIVTDELHPAARATIGKWLSEARHAADAGDAAEVDAWCQRIRARIGEERASAWGTP
jgi:hypothetical protein